jgi:hypothetical protein
MMIPKHSKVTVPENHRPTKNSVRAGERPEDCRAVGSVLALVGTYPALFVVGVFGTIGCLLLSGMGLVAGLIPRAHVGSIESLSHIALAAHHDPDHAIRLVAQAVADSGGPHVRRRKAALRDVRRTSRRTVQQM